MPKGYKGEGVKDRHKDYDAYARKWKRCRDVVSGEQAIHEAGTEYLPLLVDEPDIEFRKRIKRTPFFNASWRTIAGFVGMLFRKPPTIEVSDKIKEMLEDVTMSGITFQSFVKDAATEDIEVSRLGILVDYPSQQVDETGKPIEMTKAQVEAAGMRPVMQAYKAEQIIDWDFGRVNNKTVLTLVKLAETAVVRVAGTEFKKEDEKRIRVLDLVDGKYRMRLFKEEDETQISDDIYPIMNNKPLSEIPFYFIGPDGTDGTLDDPILIDLIDLNLKHYMVSADYEHGCHMTGLPTPVVKGYKTQYDEVGKVIPANFYIGSTTAWIFPEADADAKFLEFTGQGLTALENNLKSKEAQMAAIGARMLAPEKSGVEASATLAMRHNGEYSILAGIAIAVSEGFTKALKTFVQWAGENPDKIKFEILREFIPVIADSALITQFISLVQNGLLDEQSLFEWLKRADLVDHELTYEEMKTRVESAPPPKPVQIQLAELERDNPLDPANSNPKPGNDPKPEPKE